MFTVQLEDLTNSVRAEVVWSDEAAAGLAKAVEDVVGISAVFFADENGRFDRATVEDLFKAAFQSGVKVGSIL